MISWPQIKPDYCHDDWCIIIVNITMVIITAVLSTWTELPQYPRQGPVMCRSKANPTESAHKRSKFLTLVMMVRILKVRNLFSAHLRMLKIRAQFCLTGGWSGQGAEEESGYSWFYPQQKTTSCTCAGMSCFMTDKRWLYQPLTKFMIKYDDDWWSNQTLYSNWESLPPSVQGKTNSPIVTAALNIHYEWTVITKRLMGLSWLW